MDAKPKYIISLLEGKTIKEIKHSVYMKWMVINEIHFTNGTILELCGNADVAWVDVVQRSDGAFVYPDRDHLADDTKDI